MAIYSAVREIASKKNMSIHSIEKDLKLSNGTISKWNKSNPSAFNLQKVADYLGVTSTYLLNKSREER